MTEADALAALDERALAFYRAAASRVVPIALEKGTLAPGQAAELERLLGRG